MADFGASPSVENPFRGMKIRDWKPLEQVEGRSVCSKCNKSRKYFCYTCYITVSAVADLVPKLKLPVKIDIIKHSHEIDGKSTASHAAVIAPDDVTIYTYPCIPDYSTEENVVLIFPGKNALSIQEYIKENRRKLGVLEEAEDSPEPKQKRRHCLVRLPILKAVFIDSTWNQSRGIYKDQRLREIPAVVFQSRISQFWRHQHGSPRWFLATIEAIHQFLIEFHVCCNLGDQQSQSIADLREPSATKSPSPSNVISKAVKESCSLDEVKSSGGKQDPQTSDESIFNSESSLRHDKAPSKFVKNLALCRGVRVDSGEESDLQLFGPDQWEGKYFGEYDDLLFFFQFMYFKIHSIYDHSKLYSYQRPLK